MRDERKTKQQLIEELENLRGQAAAAKEGDASDQARQNVSAQVLELLNQSIHETDVIRQVLLLVKGVSGIEAVGLRLHEGNDYPYYESNGFPQDFIRHENFLCAQGEDGEPIVDENGFPVLECMCGNIIRGRVDPSLPFFTEGGSFWTNCSTDLLASTTEEDRQARTRNYCNAAGYESVALIPLTSHTGNIGLLQLNDHRSGAFTPASITFFEKVAGNIGVALTRKRAEEKLRSLTGRYEAILASVPDIIMEVDENKVYTWANQAGKRFFGDDVIGTEASGHFEGEQETYDTVQPVFNGAEDVIYVESWQRRDDGESRLLAWWCKTLKDGGGNATGALSTARDITELKRTEEALRETEQRFQQSQKLEAVGRLAGGIAHDFKNMLSIIIGYSDLGLMALPEGEPLSEDLRKIKDAAERANTLTRQLLAFSRKQVLQPKVLDLNSVVRELDEMLRRVIGEDVRLTCSMAGPLGRVQADPAQLEQILMNLAVNARDAMPSGGTLNIETADVELDDEYARAHVSARPGPHVMLAVSDTGCGMDQETVEHAFEPFFTTKEEGKGTGLGLSTVYGIVKQSGGNIWVYSEPGEGTTFKIYLPRVEEEPVKAKSPAVTAGPAKGSETILVVEDEESLRNLAGRILRAVGYEALEAADAGEALAISGRQRGPIDLMITDVIMPEMSGPELAERMTAERPGLKVIFMSGYTADAMANHHKLSSEAILIEKPYVGSDLLRAVREVLDAEEPTPGAEDQ